MPSDTPDHGGPDPSESKSGLNATITQGVVDVLKNPDLLPVEFKNWLPQYVDLNMLQHGYRHRNTGPDPIPIPNGVEFAFGGSNGVWARGPSAVSSDITYVPVQIVATNSPSAFGVATGSFSAAGLQIKTPGVYRLSAWITLISSSIHPITGTSGSGPYKAEGYFGNVFNMVGVLPGGRNYNSNMDWPYSENPLVLGQTTITLPVDSHFGFVYEPGSQVSFDGPPYDVIQFGIKANVDDVIGPSSVECQFLCMKFWAGKWDNVDQAFSDLTYLTS